MPESIKNKLRRYAAAQEKANSLHLSLVADFEKYGVPYENLVACGDRDRGYLDGATETEALAYINNCETGSLEESINEIERVFLYFAKEAHHD